MGFLIIEMVLRPFARIFEKMPLIMFGIMVLLYGFIAFLVLRSAFKKEQQHRPY